MSRNRIRVTDHALLRWLERTGALDVEGIRSMLGQSLERAHSAGSELGVREYLILADELLYVVRGGALITVIKDERFMDHVRALDLGQHG